jgi:hypothetical protein
MTGAMTPLGFEGSDRLQNLTKSLLAGRLLPPGIHVLISTVDYRPEDS